MEKKSVRSLVISYYPKAQAINIRKDHPFKTYYNIVNEGKVLGKGKSSKAAWKSAYRNWIE